MSSEEYGLPGWAWRGALVVMLLALAAYPLAHWLTGGGKNAGGGAPGAWQARLQSSVAHYQAGRYQDAISEAKAALAANPNLPEAYNNLAVSYLQVRMFDEGIQAAQEAIRLRPDFSLAKNNLAWIQREKANSGKTAGPASPSTPAAALLNVSIQHAQAGRFQECVDAARQSVALDPSLAPAFNNMGYCASRLQQWDVAIRNTQEAIRLAPNFQLARNNLASILQQKLISEGPTAK